MPVRCQLQHSLQKISLHISTFWIMTNFLGDVTQTSFRLVSGLDFNVCISSHGSLGHFSYDSNLRNGKGCTSPHLNPDVRWIKYYIRIKWTKFKWLLFLVHKLALQSQYDLAVVHSAHTGTVPKNINSIRILKTWWELPTGQKLVDSMLFPRHFTSKCKCVDVE